MKIKFLITVGDNFYFTGVENVYDDRFDSTFADVYNGDILQKPWYMIGGNHDHFGNITAQTAYTNQSSRWTYPSLYYKVSYKFSAKNTSVDFLMIDTIVLCGNTRDIDNAGFFDMIFADVSKNPNNPRDPEAARKQWQWIEEQLSQSKADYLFVAGHYPIYSVSEHGPTQCLVDKLNPLLRKYKASAYFSGHDHNLQHLMIKETYDSDGEEQSLKDESEPSVMHYIISGAGSRSDRSMKHKNNVPVGSHLFSYPTGFNPFSQLGFTNGGFVGVEVSDQSANFKFFSGESQQKYDCSIRRRIF
ncbi:unnamed protein product [Anisakis simplex]|uniref:Tartrate-resistant acid phosphatase type 5 n=1 Tax=Anisakis simplex TaxID=6269 RepID=A0A0M3JY56_ANISI|nr:unnamed protein product [Anisakis simplex]